MDRNFCYDNCKHLSVTEAQQTKFMPSSSTRADHLCTKHSIRVRHEYYHPKIVRPKFCKYKQFLDIIKFWK